MLKYLLFSFAWFIISPAAIANSLGDLKNKYKDRNAIHRFVDLSEGSTHYQFLTKKAAQPIVILVHGSSGPLQVYDQNVNALSEAGFNVLRFDFYGRGLSARPSGTYDLNRYVTQLKELLESLNISESFHLVGSSMGSLVVTEFSLRYSKRVKSLSLIGPAGFPIRVPFLAHFRDLPWIGNLLFKYFGVSTIIQQNENYFVNSAVRENFMPYFKDQIAVDGSAEALLSTMRHTPMQNFSQRYADLRNRPFPLHVVWGENDQTFPISHLPHLVTSVSPNAVLRIPEAAHLPQYEAPQTVNAFLIKSFRDAE